MAEQTEIEIVKKLLKSGFDMNLISFELNIPIELVRQCKSELENINVNSAEKTNSVGKKIYTAREAIDEKNNQAKSKIDQMRERYNELYFGSNSAKVAKPKERQSKERTQLSREELEFIETVIETIRTNIQKMKTLPQKDRRKIAFDIIAKLKNIEEYQLPMEQAEELYNLMCSEQLDKLNPSSTDQIDIEINHRRRKCAIKLAQAIDIEQSNVADLEELQRLAKKITARLVNESPIYIDPVRIGISSRITDIRKQQAIDRIRNNIPTSIVSIITDLASGTIDMQKANQIIDEEAKRKVEGKPKTRFSMTEEQERGQILTQIRTIIAENVDEYHIQNPEKTILQIQELCGGSAGLSVRTVVKNLIGRKDFERAKDICNKFSKTEQDEEQGNEKARYVRAIREDIRNAEISDIVMKAINMRGTTKEARAYFDLIEQGLNMGNVKMQTISLGKNMDGTRDITLADVWADELQKDKKRV